MPNVDRLLLFHPTNLRSATGVTALEYLARAKPSAFDTGPRPPEDVRLDCAKLRQLMGGSIPGDLTLVDELGSDKKLGQHISLLASLSPVVEETILTEGTQQARASLKSR